MVKQQVRFGVFRSFFVLTFLSGILISCGQGRNSVFGDEEGGMPVLTGSGSKISLSPIEKQEASTALAQDFGQNNVMAMLAQMMKQDMDARQAAEGLKQTQEIMARAAQSELANQRMIQLLSAMTKEVESLKRQSGQLTAASLQKLKAIIESWVKEYLGQKKKKKKKK